MMHAHRRTALSIAAIVWVHAVSASAGIVDGCKSTAWIEPAAPLACWLVCPKGDGPALQSLGRRIVIRVVDDTGTPIPGISRTEICLHACGPNDPRPCLCPLHPDAPTDANGEAVFSGAAKWGACADAVFVVVQGSVIEDASSCPGGFQPLCIPIQVVSPDFDSNGIVDLIDFSTFAQQWQTPGTVCPRSDLNCSGFTDVIDFALFAQHFLHEC